MDPPPDDEAMAQAMGFSSFGAQNRPQKRKYNPHADAIVSSNSRTAQRAARPSATGSNSTPLGVHVKKPDQAATANANANANADEIDLDQDEDEGEGEGDYDDDGIASTTAGIPEKPSESLSTAALVRPPGLPDRPESGAEFGGSPGGNQDYSPRTVWYEGYYDRKSNENPWRRLEEAKGLQPLGTWISQGHQASAST